MSRSSVLPASDRRPPAYLVATVPAVLRYRGSRLERNEDGNLEHASYEDETDIKVYADGRLECDVGDEDCVSTEDDAVAEIVAYAREQATPFERCQIARVLGKIRVPDIAADCGIVLVGFCRIADGAPGETSTATVAVHHDGTVTCDDYVCEHSGRVPCSGCFSPLHAREQESDLTFEEIAAQVKAGTWKGGAA